MANVLSQEEIDALLGGLSDGQIPAGSERSGQPVTEGSVASYDFNDQDRFLRGRLPTLETIHDRFVRLLRMNLSTTLRRPVDIQIGSQALCSFSDFTHALEKPASLHLLKMDPLKGSGLLVLPGRFILNLVDLLFGGEGKPIEIGPERDFTLIETRVIHKIATEICRCYTESWTSVHPIKIEPGGSETNLQFINIAQPSDPVNVVDCDVTIEGHPSTLSICIPYATLEPIKEALKGAYLGDRPNVAGSWTKRIGEALNESSIDVQGRLGSASLTLRDLLRLRTGDVLQLNEDYEHPVEIMVEGVRKFWGVVGAYKSGRALQITGIIPPKRNAT